MSESGRKQGDQLWSPGFLSCQPLSFLWSLLTSWSTVSSVSCFLLPYLPPHIHFKLVAIDSFHCREFELFLSCPRKTCARVLSPIPEHPHTLRPSPLPVIYPAKRSEIPQTHPSPGGTAESKVKGPLPLGSPAFHLSSPLSLFSSFSPTWEHCTYSPHALLKLLGFAFV
jgi:hypothetical protein